MLTQTAPEDEYIFSISELNENARNLLESHFGDIWVNGEISNLSRPTSGHCYFTLKDTNASIQCAYFRHKQRGSGIQLENGLAVTLSAKVSLYCQRGDYQLLVQHVLPAGNGHLQLAFEQLKKQLQQAGLFDPLHKKRLPVFPQCIGIITSFSGAAIKDVLSIIQQRYPLVSIKVYDSQVQGTDAPKQLLSALKQAQVDNDCDVLLLTRGGGAIEDLWAFNDESLAREIYRCDIPIISAVGHEIDFTIADFVADVRSPTPSAAAELLVPNRITLEKQLRVYLKRLTQYIQQQHQYYQLTILHLNKQLVHPQSRIGQQWQRLDNNIKLMHKIIHNLLQHKILNYQHHASRFIHLDITRQLSDLHKKVADLSEAQDRAARHMIKGHTKALGSVVSKLEAISPLKTIARGYAMVEDASGQLINSATLLAKGQQITTRLKDGMIYSTVNRIQKTD